MLGSALLCVLCASVFPIALLATDRSARARPHQADAAPAIADGRDSLTIARVETATSRTGAKKNPTWYFYQAGLYFEIRLSELVVRTNPFGRASLILSFRAH